MGKADETYDFHDQIGHLLRRAYQRHVAIFQDSIPDSDLTLVQFVALCAVQEMQGCSLNDVVNATSIDQATIRGVIDRLKARNLVAVSPDETDRRKLVISITREGASLIEKTIPFAKAVTQSTYGDLNEGERVAILFLLRKMLQID